MDRIFSARLDEAVLDELDRITKRLGMTKKEFLEEAIRARAAEVNAEAAHNVWRETLGAWKRREAPQTTIRRIRKTVEESFTRLRRG
jgi:predicted DNA-binding protein